MGTQTAIEWADATVNTGMGCTKVSSGCKNCYMFRLMARFGKDGSVPVPRDPTKIAKSIADLGPVPCTVFLNSMTDTFHPSYPDDLIATWLDLIARTPHTYLILTKRAGRMADYFSAHPLPDNAWVGVSVESPAHYDRIHALLRVQTVRRFISFEPLLDSVHDAPLFGISWVIVGGESDPGAPRRMDPRWAIEMRDRCKQLLIPFFYKQTGGSRKINGAWGGNELAGRRHIAVPREFTRRPVDAEPDRQTKLFQ